MLLDITNFLHLVKPSISGYTEPKCLENGVFSILMHLENNLGKENGSVLY